MNYRSITFMAAVITISAAYSQEAGIRAITKSHSEEYMKFLSSDEMEGRRTGSQGNNAAAEYISEAASETGVRPLPGRSDLFQRLDYLRVSVIPDSSFLTVMDTCGNVICCSKVKPVMSPIDQVDLSGDIVFGGYGYMNSEAKYNDFEGISVNDKIVIIMTRTPDLTGSGLPATGSLDETIETKKLPLILFQRPKALLYVADPSLENTSGTELLSFSDSYSLVPLFRKQFNFSFNAYIISGETADALLKNSGKTLASLQREIADTKKPASFIVPDAKAEIRLSVRKDTVTSSNIIGYIEGSDPELKNECVIYTAHYDHVGKDQSGTVFNGANDNASGSTGLLNVAHAFASLEKKPRRSIVFLWTTGEEEGLHGSSYYIENPLFPIDKTVATINFDMIGRSRMSSDRGASLTGSIDITGPDTIKVISGGESSAFIRYTKEACQKTGLYMIDEGKGTHFSGSDHFPFFKRGIPVVFFFTGIHKDYHKQTDDFEFIDFDKLVKVSRAGFLTGYRVANDPERLVKDNTGM